MQIAYFFITLYLVFFYSQKNLDKDKNKSLEVSRFILLVISLALFWGLRNQKIGNDSVTYIKIFQNPEFYSLELEAGFLAFFKLLRFVSTDGNYLLFSLSFILLFFQLLVYYKLNSKNFFIYFIIYTSFYYYYQFHLNIMRQGIAILFVSMAYLAYRQRKLKIFVLWGILATLMHVTALVFLLYPAFSIRITKKKYQVLFICFILLTFFTHFVSVAMNAVPDFHWSVAKLKWYFVISEPVHIKQSHFISLAIIFIFTLFFEKMKRSSYFGLYTFHTIFFAFIGFFHECVTVYDRFYFYLQIFEPLLLYEFRILFKEKRIYKNICLSASILMSLITIFIWGPRNFLSPYSFQFLR